MWYIHPEECAALLNVACREVAGSQASLISPIHIKMIMPFPDNASGTAAGTL